MADITIRELVEQSYRNSADHGFWDGERTDATIPMKLALIMSEGGEALESYRDPVAEREIKVDISVFETMVNLLDKAYDDANSDERSVVNLGRHLIEKWKAKPKGFEYELADIMIRVADLAGALDIDLDEAIAVKHAFNQSRPRMHGRKV